MSSTLCSAEITFKTDPKNTDYAAEHGASRNFEPWRDTEKEEIDRLAKLEEEENNPMKALENRTTDSKREMDILDALQDIRARNARNERVAQGKDTDDLIERLQRGEEEDDEAREKRLADEEDEALVREVFSKVNVPGPSSLILGASPVAGDDSPNGEGSASSSSVTLTVKRKAEGEQPELRSLLSDSTKSLLSSKSSAPVMKKKKTDFGSSLGIKVVKGKGKAVKV